MMGHSSSDLQPAVLRIKKKSYCSALIPLKTTTSLRSSQISWGFPTSPGLQTHMARWFLTLHSAPIPQDSVKHGFSHFSFMHARWEGQSGSTKHSGWGAEKESVMQVRNLWTWCAVIFDRLTVPYLNWTLFIPFFGRPFVWLESNM